MEWTGAVDEFGQRVMGRWVVQLVLLGVCCSGSGVGGDPFTEVTLQPLPQYTIPTDGVTMTCITHTDTGRIFLGGRDGHLYELIYSTGGGWQSRCRKVCHTGGLGNLLSRCCLLTRGISLMMVGRLWW